MERRLAAIVLADIVGYSHLMGDDEAGTLTAVAALRSTIIDPAVEARGGRLVKSMGDGFLLEFASAVDAVECSAEIQGRVAEMSGETKAAQSIELRIGINVGDIMVEDGDVSGDGVNVAARLEGLADPGGILLSQAAYDQVRDRVRYSFDDLGDRSLKNIARPVKVFRLVMGRPSKPRRPRLQGDFGDLQAVAVLPFDNLSKDPAEDYFVEGLTEDIITALAYWRWFPVVARNSTFVYKGKPKNVTEIGRELGAAYLVEGSARRRRTGSHHRAAHRRGDRPPPVRGALRPQDRRCLHRAGRDRRTDRGQYRARDPSCRGAARIAQTSFRSQCLGPRSEGFVSPGAYDTCRPWGSTQPSQACLGN